MRDTQALHLQKMPLGDTDRSAVGPMRMVVLDDGHDLVERMENALWVWPHKLLAAAHVEEAIEICKQETVAAILIAVDRNKMREAKSIPALRRRLPEVPIVAVVSAEQATSAQRYLEQGADALLQREDADRPILHDFISGLVRGRADSRPGRRSASFVLGRPWRQSEIVGALICDSKGTVLDANGTLATWLGYEDVEALRGRSFPCDVLADRDDWTGWLQVAGDTAAFLQSEAGIITRDGRPLRLYAEVFAAPGCPSHIQAVFKDPVVRGMAVVGA